jgi:hypothetical protein
MSIILWIFFIILILIIGALLIPINISIEYNSMGIESELSTKDTLRVILNFLCFDIKIFPISTTLTKKEAKTKINEKKRLSKVKKTDADDGQNKSKSKFSLIENIKFDELISLGGDFYNIINRAVKKLLRVIKIYNVNLIVVVSGEDAADTGLKYSRLNYIIYSIYVLLNRMFNMRDVIIQITPNFLDGKSQIAFRGKIKFSLMNILFIAVAVFTKIAIIICRMKFSKRKA